MKSLVLICAVVASATAARYSNGYISKRQAVFPPNANIQYNQFPFESATFESATTEAAFDVVPSTDKTSSPSVDEWRERKTHQFEAEPKNTFARHPERQIIGILNTDFVPSDEYTDFLLAYLPEITEILKEIKIANGGEMPALGNNPAHWMKMALPLARRYLKTRAGLEGRDYLWPGEEKALNFVDRVAGPMMQFVQELSDV